MNSDTSNGTADVTLSDGARQLLQRAEVQREEWKHDAVGLHHVLLALLARNGAMAESMASGFITANERRNITDRLKANDPGPPLSVEEWERESCEVARSEGKATARERDLAAVALKRYGFTLLQEPTPIVQLPLRREPVPPSDSSATEPIAFAPIAGTAPKGDTADNSGASVGDETHDEGDASAAPSSTTPYGYRPRCKVATPALDHFARDLTRQAAEGKLRPVVGRDEEITLLIETLCRHTKRNPVLVGPAGCGKTAIVEGFAQRVVLGQVPSPVANIRVLALQPSVLVAGAGMVGEMENRMQALLAEAANDGIVLFIDEIHSVMGAGGREGTGDMGSQLKPALARDAIACIGATTDDEYRRFIENDAALERRFGPVPVLEMNVDATFAVLQGLRDHLSKLRGVTVSDEVLRALLGYSERFLRNRYFPDKAVDLLEQSVAATVAASQPEVTMELAQKVVQRMVGLPTDPAERLTALRARLEQQACLDAESRERLYQRLEITLRGLDVHRSRANAVVMMAGEAAIGAEILATVLAEELCGGAERMVSIDAGSMTDHYSLSMLLGSAPGYVGYNETLPLHRIAKMPYCVLVLENIESAHFKVRDVIRRALEEGFFTDARGKRIYISDAVVVLSAPIPGGSSRRSGLRPVEESPSQDAEVTAQLRKSIDSEFLELCDVVVTRQASAGHHAQWVENNLLGELAKRFAEQNLHLQWDKSVVDWLVNQRKEDLGPHQWEKLVEDRLSPALIPHLPAAGRPAIKMKVSYSSDCVQLHPMAAANDGPSASGTVD